ncbi:unnamed protein product [Linum tenue]|uniref:Malonyl-CoA:ACP transacylase (MAT) domain-containing protein n=1 Tax=Linum tenue TaxID=586396 RepID=A0AAV0IQP2_9ROSI|nr:unnamed protein product [Linum tenue]
MRSLLFHHHLHCSPCHCLRSSILRKPSSLVSAAMASSLALPAISPNRISFAASEALNGCCRNGARGFGIKNFGRSRVFMSVSVGSQTVVDDSLFADYKPSAAFLFPGQEKMEDEPGAQAVGMGKEAQSVSAAAELYKKANDILGTLSQWTKEKLDSTVISQPAIYVTSLAAVEMLRARDGGQQIIDAVDVTCGLSLGEYTALAFSGAFSFEDGLKLVKLRGEAMQCHGQYHWTGLDKVQQLCDAANQEVDETEKVQIANFLCTGNYAVSGGVKGVEAVEAKAKSFKARMTVTSPVQWETTVKTLLSKGLKKSYELGPGKVIAGIVKRMDRGAEIENIGA